jgi:FAD/FMN-containing dehydrogenase
VSTVAYVPETTDLTAAVTGPVLVPGDPGFAEEVTGYNLASAPAPAVVVGAVDADDVAAAVRWAVAHDRRVAVQATGHGLYTDLGDTVLVSTRRMDAVTVDPSARTAVVGAGARWRAVIDAAAPHGLAPLCGSSSTVGVVGFTTGGGLGPLNRRYGFAADHVRRFRIVTADGQVREASPEWNADLFWAVRGGKGNLGIVTEIELDLLPVARFYGGGLFFPASAANVVLHAWREWAPTLPEDASTSVALLQLPPDPALPAPLQGEYVAHVRFVHLGTPAEGEALLAPMRAVAAPLVDAVGEMPFAAIDAVHVDPPQPLPFADRGAALASLPAAAVDALLAVAGGDPAAPRPGGDLRDEPGDRSAGAPGPRRAGAEPAGALMPGPRAHRAVVVHVLDGVHEGAGVCTSAFRG